MADIRKMNWGDVGNWIKENAGTGTALGAAGSFIAVCVTYVADKLGVPLTPGTFTLDVGGVYTLANDQKGSVTLMYDSLSWKPKMIGLY